MLFQVLCGFEPIFYTTHPNEESKKLKITINFNENNVNIGDAYETKITIPKDCKKVR